MVTVVGLGNPGNEYTYTRHNVGAYVLSLLAEKNNFTAFQREKYIHGSVSTGSLADVSCVFVIPETYMNESGQSVRALINNGTSIEELIVVYDDLDIPFGSIKLSFDRGTAGHNGLASIIEQTHTREFIRIRVGIEQILDSGEAKKVLGHERADFVLKRFSKEELDMLEQVAEKVEKAIITISSKGIAKAMTEINAA